MFLDVMFIFSERTDRSLNGFVCICALVVPWNIGWWTPMGSTYSKSIQDSCAHDWGLHIQGLFKTHVLGTCNRGNGGLKATVYGRST